MHYFKGFIPLIISVLIFSDAAIAQNTEKYLNVGQDTVGDPFLLDTTTMGKIERGFGSVLLVYQVKNGMMDEILVRASCTETRLWILGFRAYDQNGIKVDEYKEQREVPIKGDNPASKSMQYYCHAIGARGW